METVTVTLNADRTGRASGYLGGLTKEAYVLVGDVPNGATLALLTPDGRTLAVAEVTGNRAEVDTDTQEVADLLRYQPVGAEAQVHIAIGSPDDLVAIVPATMRKNWLDDANVHPPVPLTQYWTAEQTKAALDAEAEARKQGDTRTYNQAKDYAAPKSHKHYIADVYGLSDTLDEESAALKKVETRAKRGLWNYGFAHEDTTGVITNDLDRQDRGGIYRYAAACPNAPAIADGMLLVSDPNSTGNPIDQLAFALPVDAPPQVYRRRKADGTWSAWVELKGGPTVDKTFPTNVAASDPTHAASTPMAMQRLIGYVRPFIGSDGKLLTPTGGSSTGFRSWGTYNNLSWYYNPKTNEVMLYGANLTHYQAGVGMVLSYTGAYNAVINFCGTLIAEWDNRCTVELGYNASAWSHDQCDVGGWHGAAIGNYARVGMGTHYDLVGQPYLASASMATVLGYGAYSNVSESTTVGASDEALTRTLQFHVGTTDDSGKYCMGWIGVSYKDELCGYRRAIKISSEDFLELLARNGGTEWEGPWGGGCGCCGDYYYEEA